MLLVAKIGVFLITIAIALAASFFEFRTELLYSNTLYEISIVSIELETCEIVEFVFNISDSESDIFMRICEAFFY